MNGNAAGTDCVDASSYTGVSFSLSGSLMGTGCAMQFAINDSEHDQIIPGVIDPKAAGPVGSDPPQLSITSAELVSTAVTIKVPFAGANALTGGSPPIPIDPFKLVGLLWQMSTPTVASDGGAAGVRLEHQPLERARLLLRRNSGGQAAFRISTWTPRSESRRMSRLASLVRSRESK